MSALAGRLAEALRLMIERAACEVESLHELGRDDDDTAEEALVAQSELDTARAALAEYEATPRAYFPADYIREKLEKYDAEIADGTVSYPFYSGVFSQVARGMLERIA